ncbi:hypothetical protein IEQ34_006818 [Dendrobium chrysotoxum]|uniref:Uncharacterized protein n=1 Tax=Dendrobium chrysotoxum TaxID=161865 RepID=A0AAV7H6L0_DENCH|nr:hypothetical protein IEQ34_006818 [Dendrobium chrysotoxum]
MKLASVKDENKRFQSLLSKKETALSKAKRFKKTLAFKSIIQDHVQQAHDYIYAIVMKDLEQQYIEEGLS